MNAARLPLYHGRGLAMPRVKEKREVINARTVPCPDCHVGAGEWCENAGTKTSHKVRRRMAIRKLNAERAS